MKAEDSTTEVVRYERRGPVTWVTINRPEVRNALDRGVREGLFAAIDRFEADSGAAVLVLTGAGEVAFSAGGDLKEMADSALAVPPPDFLPQLGRNVLSTKPVIAAVNGLAYAGGFLLVQSCDLVIAADHARFAITEARVGRGAPWAAPLPWLVAPRVALQLLLTGDPITAGRAYELGLVNEVVPAAELQDRAQAYGERIAANAPLSVRAAKRDGLRGAGAAAERGLRRGRADLRTRLPLQDAQEGPRAFAEKRAPSGRAD